MHNKPSQPLYLLHFHIYLALLSQSNQTKTLFTPFFFQLQMAVTLFSSIFLAFLFAVSAFASLQPTIPEGNTHNNNVHVKK
jgi:hypothetical protein